MKRNISVFILLILLASSFKYRTKARETGQPLLSTRIKSSILHKSPENKPDTVNAFTAILDTLQKANHELANGNPEMIKSLWSHSPDVTIFAGTKNVDLQGWDKIEPYLNAVSAERGQKWTYTYEQVATHAGEDNAYLLQQEHYLAPNGKSVNLHATNLFRKENNVWKLVHRHENKLDFSAQPDKTSK
jgi:hypothetical protein